MFKALETSDISIKPFKVYKKFVVTHTDSGSGFFGVEGITGSLYKFTPSTAPVQKYSSSIYPYSQSFYKEPIYYQIKHLYYGGKTKDYANKPILSFGPNDTSKMKRDIHNKVNVISVPTTFYGERMHPGSVKLVDNASSITVDLRDDRDGNLYDNAYSASYASYKVNEFDTSYLTAEKSGSVIGNVFYDQGIITITNSGSVYVDAGTGGFHKDDDANGWELEFKATHEITEYEYVCTANAGEFNGTTNISATLDYSGSLTLKKGSPNMYNILPPGDNPAQRTDFPEYSVGSGSFKSEYNATENYIGAVTHSEFSTYVSTIGLYDDFNRLLIVGKLSKPIKNDPELLLKFVVRFDV